MGVDGATIASTLTSAHHPIRDSPIHQARGVALLQNRQYRAADFSSDPSSTTDEPALPETADTDDRPQDSDISRPEFLPRGNVFPSVTLDNGGVLPRGDRPAINFRQPLRRADSGDNGENDNDVLPRLDSGVSMNAMSDVIPTSSTKPLSDSLASPASNLTASNLHTSNMPASNASANNSSASTSPAGTIGSSPMSNAVGTSNLMNSALGSGGVRDELSNFGPRETAVSHGMGSVSVAPALKMARATTDDAADDLEEEDADENDTVDVTKSVAEVTNESDMDDAAENVDEDTNESDTDDNDAGDDALESRQHGRSSSSTRPHPPRPKAPVTSKAEKTTNVMKGKNHWLEAAKERMAKKKSQETVKEGVQDVHGAGAVF